jgi:hypothetical protein
VRGAVRDGGLGKRDDRLDRFPADGEPLQGGAQVGEPVGEEGVEQGLLGRK